MEGDVEFTPSADVFCAEFFAELAQDLMDGLEVLIRQLWCGFQQQFWLDQRATIYVLVPWSSINLADYYLVRDGKYSIADIFAINGMYGKYNISTLAIYFVAIASTLPFMDVSFYHSYFAKLLNADISWIPALIVPGALYYFVNSHNSRRRFESPVADL